jgi:ubiquitin C-terminal hydrolase
MMPHIIPGGRQRASSDGDVLEDEDDTINASGILDRLTEAHRNVSRSAILSTTDDDRESSKSSADSEKLTKSKKKTLSSKISFKSVKKAVKNTLFGSSTSLNKDEMPASIRASSASGVWTPALSRRAADDENNTSSGHNGHRSNKDGSDNSGTDSKSRPLVTDPGQLIATWDRTPGNVGLFNHGNTCFMNAVLQCLSHTDSFTEYFVTGLFKDDLKNSRNSSKKQGSKIPKGEVTEQLGTLLKCLWSEKYNSEISLDFKAVVGKYNSQYKGSSQHDSQEFLLWLLDRVHEDVALPSAPTTKKKLKQIKVSIFYSV